MPGPHYQYLSAQLCVTHALAGGALRRVVLGRPGKQSNLEAGAFMAKKKRKTKRSIKAGKRRPAKKRGTKVDPHNTQAVIFMEYACQYYATARFAMHAQRMPVCGNLFHHAVEMAMKGGLARKRHVSELRYMGHRLKALWREFKKEHPDPGLARHDETISRLDKFEAIRYPEMTGSIAIAADWFSDPPPVTTSGGLKAPKQYPLVVRDIDNLIADVFKATSWKPSLFMGLNAAALSAISRHNDHADLLTRR
jgi:hypothetical protein